MKQILYDQWQRKMPQPAEMMFGETYFVDGVNGSDTLHDGLSWPQAVATVGKAITLSNTNVALAANIGKRNKIYVTAGSGMIYDEDLTVLPKQCDLIGVGFCYGTQTLIRGTHTVATASQGTHFYDFDFSIRTGNDAANFTLATAGCMQGLEFHRCNFTTGGISSGTIGVALGNNIATKILDCEFRGHTYGLKVTAPTQFCLCRIERNNIQSTTYGIWLSGNTTACYGTLIKDNVIAKEKRVSGTDELTYGFYSQSTNNDYYLVHNWIVADDCIKFQDPSQEARNCIDNSIIEDGTADRATTYE